MSSAASSTVPTGTPRIAIVTTDPGFYPAEDPDYDTPILLDALAARGVDAVRAIWHDPAVDWASFDLAVLRSTWDYTERFAEFTAWLGRAASTAPLVNPPALVRWNLDKHYLQDLERAGVAIVPTVYAETLDAARDALASHAGRVVVKPTVSAGARDTGLFEASDPAALALAERILAAGGGARGVAMIQPEIAELTQGHEKALYVIGGRETHAIAKGALLAPGGGFANGVYIEHPEPVDVTAAERAFAVRVAAAVAEITGTLPLYARVDIVDSALYGVVLLEVELIEPALNLHVAPEAISAVADAIVAAVQR
ncbi:hypothetical protein [uncultured Microbacterium sp.]|uniref:ATP-grasp domain-containing protein n=1 Tax=uncultured Microbacterium sp. TaxID=191216 RepID=UPI0025E251C1|nr:hypothetical protein [uncultured Microbacterium sp.]